LYIFLVNNFKEVLISNDTYILKSISRKTWYTRYNNVILSGSSDNCFTTNHTRYNTTPYTTKCEDLEKRLMDREREALKSGEVSTFKVILLVLFPSALIFPSNHTAVWKVITDANPCKSKC